MRGGGQYLKSGNIPEKRGWPHTPQLCDRVANCVKHDCHVKGFVVGTDFHKQSVLVNPNQMIFDKQCVLTDPQQKVFRYVIDCTAITSTTIFLRHVKTSLG